MRSFGLGAAVGLGVGSLGTYILVSQTQREKVSESGASRRTEHPAVKHGHPIGNRMKYFTGYVAALDSSRGNPAWVLEHVTKDSSRGPGDRAKSDFYEEKSVEQRFRSSLSAYKGSGYDRGHMAPAQNHKGSQQAMNDTHSLMNICPQVGKGFNRDYWARLEMFVKQLALKKGNEVYVVTGPLYVPKRTENGKGWVMQHPMIGRAPRMTAVPTHFYKIVLVEETAKRGTTEGPSGNISCGAFVMPNEPIDPATPLTDYLVPLQMLESVSGYKFFPRLIDDKDRARLDDSAAKLSTLGLSSSSKAKPLMIEDGSVADDKPAAVMSRSNSLASQGSADEANIDAAYGAGKASPGDRLKVAAAANGVPNGNKNMSHLCDSFTCKLPAQDFWMSSAANKNL